MSSEFLKIAGAIALPLAGGLLISFLIRPEIQGWYQGLNLPSFRPPNWMFPPVWTTLYVGMGYASYLVWRDGGGFNGNARVPLILYGVQLVLNWAWSPIFFNLHELKWSFVVSLALVGMVAITGVLFFKVNKVAGYIFIPYLAWCSYASMLTYVIYTRNPVETATTEGIARGS